MVVVVCCSIREYFLDSGNITIYWANTSSNSLVGKLIREGDRKIKEKFEILLRGESIYSPIDEQIVYNQLNGNERAVWSLLLASGYLKETVQEALKQIEQKQYASNLIARGIPKERIRKYGFAFEGKKVLIG